MTRTDFDIIAVGGSSGAIPLLIRLINSLPDDFRIPFVIIIHRMKNVESELDTVLSATKNIREPEDKEQITGGSIYLAPQNYHLLAEENKTFSLDYSEHVNYSRPSIDVSFMSISDVYRRNTLGILLSGANGDGAGGVEKIIVNGGCVVAQDPAEAEFPAMPRAGVRANKRVEVAGMDQIIDIVVNILKKKNEPNETL